MSAAAPARETTVESGTVRAFNAEKGYGFIRTSRSADLFVHISQVTPCRALDVGETVEFEVGEDKAGRTCAVNVKVSER